MTATITISGRMAAPAEVRTVGAGTVASFSVAVATRVKEHGSWANATTWYRVSAWSKIDQGTLARRGAKGRTVIVSGQLRGREWTAKDGSKNLSLEIDASHVEIPWQTPDDDQPSVASAAVDAVYSADTGNPGGDDGLPF